MPTSAAPPPARTTAYGDDPAQVYDVRLPTTRSSGGTVVVVHGGFWRREWDREHAAVQAQGFADAGHHVAVVEYRRTGMPGGGWPGTFQDVSTAVSAIRSDATLPDRCLLVGHSAGGHLVALAAAEPWAHGLAGAVGLAGCVDLALTAERNLGGGAAQAFLGGPPTETDDPRWRDADPALHPPAVPVVLVHGTEDRTVPLAISQSYLTKVSRSAEQHAEVALHGIPGAGHFDVIDPGHSAFATVLALASDLLRH
jgi:acetyl esterase/lipase